MFDCLPPGGALNRWSTGITREHDFPGAQAMLYGATFPEEKTMKNAPQVGIATVWWQGNPLIDFGQKVRRSVEKEGMLGWQFNTIGVSDAITMGGNGKCDKKMPGVVMASARDNRSFLMIYGGTIRKLHSDLLEKEVNIPTCYEAAG
ncbi:hypothetical protein ARSEF1564_009123 [Beauveria bassiana]